MSQGGPAPVAIQPGRGCWFCDRVSATDALMGGHGTMAPLSASALFGEDRMAWGLDGRLADHAAAPSAPTSAPADR